MGLAWETGGRDVQIPQTLWSGSGTREGVSARTVRSDSCCAPDALKRENDKHRSIINLKQSQVAKSIFHGI